jgi:hypothetical protein
MFRNIELVNKEFRNVVARFAGAREPDPAARRQEGPRVPPRESAPQQRRVAVPGEAPQHYTPKRRSGEM